MYWSLGILSLYPKAKRLPLELESILSCLKICMILETRLVAEMLSNVKAQLWRGWEALMAGSIHGDEHHSLWEKSCFCWLVGLEEHFLCCNLCQVPKQWHSPSFRQVQNEGVPPSPLRAWEYVLLQRSRYSLLSPVKGVGFWRLCISTFLPRRNDGASFHHRSAQQRIDMRMQHIWVFSEAHFFLIMLALQ